MYTDLQEFIDMLSLEHGGNDIHKPSKEKKEVVVD